MHEINTCFFSRIKRLIIVYDVIYNYEGVIVLSKNLILCLLLPGLDILLGLFGSFFARPVLRPHRHVVNRSDFGLMWEKKRLAPQIATSMNLSKDRVWKHHKVLLRLYSWLRDRKREGDPRSLSGVLYPGILPGIASTPPV